MQYHIMCFVCYKFEHVIWSQSHVTFDCQAFVHFLGFLHFSSRLYYQSHLLNLVSI